MCAMNGAKAIMKTRPQTPDNRLARPLTGTRVYRLPLLLLLLTGLLLRSLRLTWQPLWWDEGYSVYFATEPIGRMLGLTAHDIHPPLYYALLHGWLSLWQSAQPLVLRLFSLLIGVAALPLLAWLAHTFFPHQARLPQLAMFLLLINPLHLFYSQEVRMYGLALALGMASTVFFWQIIGADDGKSSKRRAYVGYVIAATLALYTLYYLAFLLLAHFVWAAWHFRRQVRRTLGLVITDSLIALLYLPWLLYVGSTLTRYVTGKIRSDNDTPLTPLAYLVRHLIAFSAGHLTPLSPLLQVSMWLGVISIGILVLAMRNFRLAQRYVTTVVSPSSALTTRSAQSALWTCLGLPLGVGFLLNLRFPFFPQGGERVLLFLLPYGLLLIAVAINQTWHTRYAGRVALTGFAISALIGIWTFYTLPRYVEHDYRALIGQVMQQGRDEDTVLTIFPWQVGYWRAYAPTANLMLTHGPRPKLVTEGALTWGAPLQNVIDVALRQGTLWFPAPLSFGSTLPGEIEAYVAPHTANLVDDWISPATRLLAWHSPPAPAWQPTTAEFGAASASDTVRLTAASVAPLTVASANQPVDMALAWAVDDPTQNVGVTLRLKDEIGYTWASRDYQLGRLGSVGANQQAIDQVGLIVPTGLPPGRYQIAVGVHKDDAESLLPTTQGNADAITPGLVELAALTVTLPSGPLPPFRLPIQTAATPLVTTAGVTLLGAAGVQTAAELLAGDPLNLSLFLQIQSAPAPDRQLYISLLNQAGTGMAGWEGWPLANHPLSSFPANALLQTPVEFLLPPTLPGGDYQLITGFLNSETGEKSSPARLDQVRVRQRSTNYTQPPLAYPLQPPIQLGTHALLLGYDYAQKDAVLTLQLYWQVLQTLAPAHDIFVHLDTANGTTLAQADQPPVTASGRAPTASWLPNEFLTTLHTLQLPITMEDDMVLQVGLYLPTTGQRLPASRNGVTVGDAVEISLQP